jgi:hypothetical protein
LPSLKASRGSAARTGSAVAITPPCGCSTYIRTRRRP